MNRREFLRLVGIGSTASIGVMSTHAVGETEKPNIVLLLVDDMGFSDIGCFGSEIDTPNIDQLAKEGVAFTQCYNGTRCMPSRGSLITGLYPHQAGTGSNGSHSFKGKALSGYLGELSPDSVTIAEVLGQAGYRSYTAGKWHLCGKKDAVPGASKHSWPLQRGFDKCYAMLKSLGSFYDPGCLIRDNEFISPFNDSDYEVEADDYYFTTAITDNTIKYIRDHRKETPDKPFFAYVAYNAPHFPMHAKEDAIAKHKGKYDEGYDVIRKRRFDKAKKLGVLDSAWELPPLELSWADESDKAWFARSMEVYAAMIDSVDRDVGRLVEELKAEGIYDNTLIFFVSDNGGCAQSWHNNDETEAPEELEPMSPKDLQLEYMPERTRDGTKFRYGKGVPAGSDGTYAAYGKGWAQVSNSPFRGYKFQCYEGGIATPLIISWPKSIDKKGTMIKDFPAHIIDIMATCVDAAGAQYPKERNGHSIIPMQGISLVPAMSGVKLTRKDALYFSHSTYAAIRQGRWKLVLSKKNIYFHDNAAWELYDMERDRTETTNLASAYPEKVSAMKKQWLDWGMNSKVFPSQKFGDGTPQGVKEAIESR